MTLSKSEQNHIRNANVQLRGIIISSDHILEIGTFETEDMTQTVKITDCLNVTSYPQRKCFDVEIKQSYKRISLCHTLYKYRIYVDDEYAITEITPLYIILDTGRLQRRKTATKKDYQFAVYRLLLDMTAT